MIPFVSRLALAFSFAAFFPFLLSFAAPETQGSEADIAAIKQLVATYSAALNHRDVQAAANCFTEDADMSDPSGVGGHGHKEIEHFYASIFAGRLTTAHREDTVKKIKFLSPDVAAVENAWTVYNAQAKDGSPVPNYSGIHAWVVVKRNGQWKIAVFHGIRFHTP